MLLICRGMTIFTITPEKKNWPRRVFMLLLTKSHQFLAIRFAIRTVKFSVSVLFVKIKEMFIFEKTHSILNNYRIVAFFIFHVNEYSTSWRFLRRPTAIVPCGDRCSATLRQPIATTRAARRCRFSLIGSLIIQSSSDHLMAAARCRYWLARDSAALFARQRCTCRQTPIKPWPFGSRTPWHFCSNPIPSSFSHWAPTASSSRRNRI